MSQPNYYAPPPPPRAMTASEERNWAMASHLIPLGAMLASAGLLGFVGSLVVYLVFKDRGPFVKRHASNSLNIQIITGIILLVSIPLMFVLIGFLSFAVAFVFAIVLHIIGAMKANNGEWWDPPMTPVFIKG